jgi:hypothetical protein
VTDEGYVVAVKPSARRASAEAGAWVNREGSTREFPGRKAADSWARTCSSTEALVYVRDANPRDDEADGYLMALRRRPRENGDDPGNPPEKTGFARYRRQREDQSGLEQFDLL